MTPELSDLYELVAYWRGRGLSEPEAYAKAEEILEGQPSHDDVKVN